MIWILFYLIKSHALIINYDTHLPSKQKFGENEEDLHPKHTLL